MKKLLIMLVLLAGKLSLWACPACVKQQPKILQGIAHGAGPKDNWDYVIVWAITLVVIATLFFSIKWIIKPEEKENNHIKRTVLNFE